MFLAKNTLINNIGAGPGPGVKQIFLLLLTQSLYNCVINKTMLPTLGCLIGACCRCAFRYVRCPEAPSFMKGILAKSCVYTLCIVYTGHKHVITLCIVHTLHQSKFTLCICMG